MIELCDACFSNAAVSSGPHSARSYAWALILRGTLVLYFRDLLRLFECAFSVLSNADEVTLYAAKELFWWKISEYKTIVTLISLLFLTVCGVYTRGCSGCLLEEDALDVACEFRFSSHNAKAGRNTKGKHGGQPGDRTQETWIIPHNFAPSLEKNASTPFSPFPDFVTTRPILGTKTISDLSTTITTWRRSHWLH